MSGMRSLAGALFLFPGLALWVSWPRRPAAAWAAGAACLLCGLLGLGWAGPGEGGEWILSSSIALAGCLYAIHVSRRGAAAYLGIEEAAAKRDKARQELESNLSAARGRTKDIESEGREVLALYGLVKGLSEALTWDDLRPTLEIAIQQYLRVEEFALYVAEEAAPDRLRPLVRRRLGSSPGGSWETLQRLLQERGLPSGVPHRLEDPERALAIPVHEGGRLVGYFYVRIPSDADAESLRAKSETFAEEISFAFRRIMLFQEVEQLSQIDGLTGVYRRGVFDEKLAEEMVRAQTFKTTFCLILLDIDHFKKLNDSYGHPFGDQVLSRIGAILRANVYETDLVARYGGEEFAILMPRAEPDGVLRKAEALRKAVESESFSLAMQQVRVTISIGIAHYPRDGASSEVVLRQADQALYSAKEAGRNRVADISVVRRTT